MKRRLDATARAGETVTYRDLALDADVPPPHRIQSVTSLLEELIRADHAAGRPLAAAVVVSRARHGLPAPGFFQLCRAIGRYFGPDHGAQAEVFHAIELREVHQAASNDSGRR